MIIKWEAEVGINQEFWIRRYKLVCVCRVTQLCLTLVTQLTVAPLSNRILCPWDSPGKITGVACHFLLQEIFPTQGSNLGLLHFRWTLYHLSHQERPKLLYIKQLNNKVILYSTRNYIQYIIINHNGKNYEKKIYIYMCVLSCV